MLFPVNNKSKVSPIELQFADFTAGALHSLKYRGMEYVDSLDHGRQIQSAWAIGGEAFNPTEAGSSIDGFTPNPSSSKVLDWWINDNQCYTKTQMAYWLPVNNKVLSNSYLIKKITIEPNYLVWETEFIIQPNLVGHCVIEVLTGYMPLNFNTGKRLLPNGTVVTATTGESSNIGILSTADSKHAMGAYTPGIPQFTGVDIGYGLTDYSQYGTYKWNNVFRLNNPSGTYKFKTFVAVGTVAEVANTLNILRAYFK